MKHNLSEKNPVITEVAKDALRGAIVLLGTARPAPEGAQAGMGVLAQRRLALEERPQRAVMTPSSSINPLDNLLAIIVICNAYDTTRRPYTGRAEADVNIACP